MPLSDVLGSSGRDPEKEVYRLLVQLRCKPFLEPYVADLRRPDKMGPRTAFPLGVKGFHSLYSGMDFRYKGRRHAIGPGPCVHILLVPIAYAHIGASVTPLLLSESLQLLHCAVHAHGSCDSPPLWTMHMLVLLSTSAVCSRAYQWGMHFAVHATWGLVIDHHAGQCICWY